MFVLLIPRCDTVNREMGYLQQRNQLELLYAMIDHAQAVRGTVEAILCYFSPPYAV